MISTIRKHKKLFILCLIFFALLYYNLSINLTGFGDDSFLFLDPLTKRFDSNVFAFLSARYHEWSSRVVIEFFTLFFVQHTFLWKIANTLVMFFCCLIPPYFFKAKEDLSYLDFLWSSAFFLAIPVSLFSETGWIATTTNYLWAYCAALVVLLPFFILIRKTKTPLSLYLLSILFVFYAANQEQLAVPLFVGLICFAIFFIYTKKKYAALATIPPLFITGINLLFTMLSPGNSLRFSKEVAERFPDFLELSFFKKIELGFSSTFRTLVIEKNMLFLFLLVILFSILCYKTQSLSLLFVSGFPLAMVLFLNYLPILQNADGLTKLAESFNQYGTSIQLMHLKTWYPDLLLLLIAFCILCSLYFLFAHRRLSYMPILFFLAAIGTRMILGFSPTIWASGSRTFLFTYALFSWIMLYALAQQDIASRKYKLLLIFIGSASLLNVMNTLFLL